MIQSIDITIHINTPTQELSLLKDSQPIIIYPISSALNGLGEISGSQQTPRGWHQIRAKIGHNLPINSVFVGRRPTGEIFSLNLARRYPDRDWILTRILWLSGLELRFNRLGKCDTMRRYIYIHGCPDFEPMGIPKSHGCIRMRNHDVIDLFDHVQPFTRVLIE